MKLLTASSRTVRFFCKKPESIKKKGIKDPLGKRHEDVAKDNKRNGNGLGPIHPIKAIINNFLFQPEIFHSEKEQIIFGFYLKSCVKLSFQRFNLLTASMYPFRTKSRFDFAMNSPLKYVFRPIFLLSFSSILEHTHEEQKERRKTDASSPNTWRLRSMNNQYKVDFKSANRQIMLCI